MKAFAGELALADPLLWDRLAPLAEQWIGLQVEEVPRLEVAACVSLPGAAPIEVLVRRAAVVSGRRLVLSSLTTIDSIDVVRCLLKGATASAAELMLVENGVRIRLLERAQIDWSQPDLSGLPGRTSADGHQEFDVEDPDVLLARYASNAQPEDSTAPEPATYPDVDDYVVLSDASADGEAPVGGQVPGPAVTIRAPGSGGEGKRPTKRTQRAVLSVEQQGLEFYIRYVLAPGGIQVSDQRLNKGVGADLVCSDGIFRELKTFSGPAPDNVKLTSHERARAAIAGSGYELVIVENIERVEVAISIIPRPLEVLEWYPAGDVQVTGWRANVVAGKFRQLRLGAKPTLEDLALAPIGSETNHDS